MSVFRYLQRFPRYHLIHYFSRTRLCTQLPSRSRARSPRLRSACLSPFTFYIDCMSIYTYYTDIQFNVRSGRRKTRGIHSQLVWTDLKNDQFLPKILIICIWLQFTGSPHPSKNPHMGSHTGSHVSSFMGSNVVSHMGSHVDGANENYYFCYCQCIANVFPMHFQYIDNSRSYSFRWHRRNNAYQKYFLLIWYFLKVLFKNNSSTKVLIKLI